jgi:hypothetical protein
LRDVPLCIDNNAQRDFPLDAPSGLFLPTAMTFGPDGDLYVSNVGFGPPPIGLGAVVRFTVPPVAE